MPGRLPLNMAIIRKFKARKVSTPGIESMANTEHSVPVSQGMPSFPPSTSADSSVVSLSTSANSFGVTSSTSVNSSDVSLGCVNLVKIGFLKKE